MTEIISGRSVVFTWRPIRPKRLKIPVLSRVESVQRGRNPWRPGSPLDSSFSYPPLLVSLLPDLALPPAATQQRARDELAPPPAASRPDVPDLRPRASSPDRRPCASPPSLPHLRPRGGAPWPRLEPHAGGCSFRALPGSCGFKSLPARPCMSTVEAPLAATSAIPNESPTPDSRSASELLEELGDKVKGKHKANCPASVATGKSSRA